MAGFFARSTRARPGSACTWQAETPSTFAASSRSTPPPPTSCPAAKAKNPASTKQPTAAKRGNRNNTDKRKEFFLDSIACLSETRCFALGDPLNGKFLLLSTTDGQHWNPLPSGNMPAALPSEGAFAASNSCLLLSGE